MEEVEELRAAGRIALVERAYPLQGVVEQSPVFGHHFLLGLGEVRQQGIADIRPRIGQVMGFQTLAEDLGAAWPYQHRGHHDERGELFGDALFEFELGQDPGRQQQGQEMID